MLIPSLRRVGAGLFLALSFLATPRPLPAQQAPAINLSGEWVDYTTGLGQSRWTLMELGGGRYKAQQTGFGNATGVATIWGSHLRFDWVTRDGYEGHADFELAPDGRSATGTETITKGASVPPAQGRLEKLP